jgi:uncharacterized damage-inducible protein DinB
MDGGLALARAFLDKSNSLLVTEYLPKIEECLQCLTDDDVWSRPNEASNSIGNLLLHLSGNVSQWILDGVGGQTHDRHRQQEFDERRHVPAADMLKRLRRIVESAADVIATQDATSLLARRRIQGYDVTVCEAIYHVVEHFGMHTGQIIWMTKARTGEDLKLWRPRQHAGP